jgi:hypothetical protein
MALAAGFFDSLISAGSVTPALERLRDTARTRQRPRWAEEWNRSARPIIERARA